MHNKNFLSFSLLILPAIVLITPPAVQSNPTDLSEVTNMKAGHHQVEGVVCAVKSGLYTVMTATGATFTLTKSTAVREGQRAPQIGDKLTLWVNEGNMVMVVHQKGHPGKAPLFITGILALIDNGASQMVLVTSNGEKAYHLRPESRMFRDLAVGTEVTIEVNDRGEVIDIHRDRTSSK